MKKKSKKRVVKKVSSSKKEDKGITYIKIGDSLPTRKDVLETAIESAEILRDWENYKKIKTKKIEVYKKLVQTLSKIDSHTNSLKRHIPSMSSIRETIPQLEKPKEEVTVEKPIKEHRSEIDREIEEIRNRLENLKI